MADSIYFEKPRNMPRQTTRIRRRNLRRHVLGFLLVFFGYALLCACAVAAVILLYYMAVFIVTAFSAAVMTLGGR